MHWLEFLASNLMESLHSFLSISKRTLDVVFEIVLWHIPIKKSLPTVCWYPPLANSASVEANCKIGGREVDKCPANLSLAKMWLNASWFKRNLLMKLQIYRCFITLLLFLHIKLTLLVAALEGCFYPSIASV